MSLGMTFGEYKQTLTRRRDALRQALEKTNENDPAFPSIVDQLDRTEKLLDSISFRRTQ